MSKLKDPGREPDFVVNDWEFFVDEGVQRFNGNLFYFKDNGRELIWKGFDTHKHRHRYFGADPASTPAKVYEAYCSFIAERELLDT